MDNALIKKGIGIGQLLFGLAFVAAGIVFIILAALYDYTLQFHSILLPQWVFYLVAAFTVLLGAVNVRYSLRTWKCASCNAALSYGEAFYPADKEKDLVEAVHALDGGRLAHVSTFSRGNEWLVLSLDYCEKCGNSGVITLASDNKNREKKTIIKPAIIRKEAVSSFFPFVKPSTRLTPLEISGE